MTVQTQRRNGPAAHYWRIAGWGLAALVLLLPLVAMQFTDEVKWTAGDFLFAAVLIGGIGLAYEGAVRVAASRSYRAAAGAALAAALLTIWANGAVGIVGDPGDPANLMFVGVLAVALVGTLAARFRAGGMAVAMAATALAEAAATVVALVREPLAGAFTGLFLALWLVSAWLFRQARLAA